MFESKPYLDIFIGDRDNHAKAQASYKETCSLLSKNAAIYGLPTKPHELSDDQQNILKDLNKSFEMQFTPPRPLLAGRLIFGLDQSPGLVKTRTNFLALCTGEKGNCKNAPNKKLHYLDCPVHRIIQGFIAQGGDVTRSDGSGGESIYGAKFADEKSGLKVKARKGSLAMANSGKNSNSSQFFVVLTDDESKLTKLNGKYVVFGQIIGGQDVLMRLEEVGGGSEGKPSERVWIGGCGILQNEEQV